jgi:type I restriction enzyme S subunit
MYVQGLQTTTDQLRDGQSIRFGQFSLLALPNPPLEEQRAIADFLDRETAKIDKLIAKQEQLVATLGERLQAEISKRVLQGLGTDADLKDSGVSWMGHIVSGWTVSRIGRHYDLTLGKMLNEQSQTEGVTLPYVRAGSIQEDGIDFENIKTMGFSSSDVKSYQILPGDVLVVEGGSIGRSIYLPGGLPNWGFQNHVIRLRALKNQFPGFVDFYIKHLKAIGHFDRLSAFATIPNLSADKLSKIEMPVPPLSQQVAIFEHLSEETRLVKELQRKAAAAVDLLQERRQALISAAVTGKILVDE